jgi:hypothetical protein
LIIGTGVDILPSGEDKLKEQNQCPKHKRAKDEKNLDS